MNTEESEHEACDRRGRLHSALCDLIAEHGIDDVSAMLHAAGADYGFEVQVIACPLKEEPGPIRFDRGEARDDREALGVLFYRLDRLRRGFTFPHGYNPALKPAPPTRRTTNFKRSR